MLKFVDDKFVKLWFYLWRVEPKAKGGYVRVEGDRIPFDYFDSRFHRALERLQTGKYVGVPVGKSPNQTKIEVDYTEAAKHYDDGFVKESPLVFDLREFLAKIDNSQLTRSERNELRLSNQVKENAAFFKEREQQIADENLRYALELHKQGKRVPAFLKPLIADYLGLTNDHK